MKRYKVLQITFTCDGYKKEVTTGGFGAVEEIVGRVYRDLEKREPLSPLTTTVSVKQVF